MSGINFHESFSKEAKEFFLNLLEKINVNFTTVIDSITVSCIGNLRVCGELDGYGNWIKKFNHIEDKLDPYDTVISQGDFYAKIFVINTSIREFDEKGRDYTFETNRFILNFNSEIFLPPLKIDAEYILCREIGKLRYLLKKMPSIFKGIEIEKQGIDFAVSLGKTPIYLERSKDFEFCTYNMELDMLKKNGPNWSCLI